VLNRSFCHLPGLREAGEEMLWRRGVLCWDDLERAAPGILSAAKHEELRAALPLSCTALATGNLGFFLRRLPRRHAVRVVTLAFEHTAFLDIETDGLGPTAQVTTAVVCRQGLAKGYVRGQDLERLRDDLRAAALLVTYNGYRFDLPVLRRESLLPPRLLHLDLCPVLHDWGHYGGLKAVSERLGLPLPTGMAHTGADAVALWRRSEDGPDRNALTELLRYNAWDACILPTLAWRLLQWSFAAYPLPRALPPCPKAPAQMALHSGTIAL
jgi:uncharacterized protein YprB with RNaseH-like and TPR domain